LNLSRTEGNWLIIRILLTLYAPLSASLNVMGYCGAWVNNR